MTKQDTMLKEIKAQIEEEGMQDLDPKEIVDAILDIPEFSKWYKNDYRGNEFDLRHEIETMLEPEPIETAEDFLNQKLPKSRGNIETAMQSIVDETIIGDIMDEIHNRADQICMGQAGVIGVQELSAEMVKGGKTEEEINEDWLMENHTTASQMLLKETIAQLQANLLEANF